MKLWSIFLLNLFFIAGISVSARPFKNLPPKVLAEHRQFSIMQGVTSKNYTSINILRNNRKQPQNLKIRITEKESGKELGSKNLSIKKFNIANSELYELKIKFSSAKNYLLYVSDSDSVDIREFSNYEQQKANLKVAVCSCLNDNYFSEQIKSWNSVSKLSPDYIFLIGDNVYADIGDKLSELNGCKPERLLNRYIETRTRLELFYLKKLIPIAMIWDDHDYGKNNGGSNYKYKLASKKIFKDFSLNENPEVSEDGLGAGFKLKLTNINFLFLDDRFYRDKKYHFGKEQEEWLFKNLEATENAKKAEIIENPEPSQSVIISGDQFFGKYHPFESFEGNQAENFKKFIEKISNLKSTPLFISGDRHISELQKIDLSPNKKIFEITSSPIHSSLPPDFTLKQFPNPHRVWAVANKNNFCVLTFHDGLRNLAVDFYDNQGINLYSKNLL
ncbi:MAG: alkaline phosphatase family protein [Cyanobacteria bacterium REEB446]|nr:alkaline phosphatase family protein [Cyanobacteria bacterium REEB446]